jgi:hypothetical protein
MATNTQAPPPEQAPLPEEEPRRRGSNKDLLDLIADDMSRQEFGKQIVEAELEKDLFAQDQRLARVFAESGAFDDLAKLQPRQAVALAMAKIQIGRSWGINPADSMQFIFFQNGRPSVQQELYAASMRDKGWDWDVQWSRDDKGKCTGCTLWLKKWDAESKSYKPVKDRQGKEVSESFTKDDADTAMVHEKGGMIKLSDKWNFKSWGRDMYFWRALSRLRRFHATNVLRGAALPFEAEESFTGEVDQTAVATVEKTAKLAQQVKEQTKAEEPKQTNGTVSTDALREKIAAAKTTTEAAMASVVTPKAEEKKPEDLF